MIRYAAIIMVLFVPMTFSWCAKKEVVKQEVKQEIPTPPDYKNWNMDSDGNPVKYKGQKAQIVFDYYIADLSNSDSEMVLIAFEPIEQKQFEEIINQGQDKFLELARKKPLLLIDFKANDGRLIIFEYKDNNWGFVKTLNEADGLQDLGEFLKTRYQLEQ